MNVDISDDMVPKSFYQEIPAVQAKEEIGKYRLIEKYKDLRGPPSGEDHLCSGVDRMRGLNI